MVRAENNLPPPPRAWRPVDKSIGPPSDQRILLQGPNSSRAYPDTPLRIRYVDTDTRKRLVFLTNNSSLPALILAHLYKCRWRVEPFFKWIKQTLRIKALIGTYRNAVKTQIWIATSVYLLVAVLKKELRIDRSLGEIRQILSITSFETVSMNQLLKGIPWQNEGSQSCTQLMLFES